MPADRSVFRQTLQGAGAGGASSWLGHDLRRTRTATVSTARTAARTAAIWTVSRRCHRDDPGHAGCAGFPGRARSAASARAHGWRRRHGVLRSCGRSRASGRCEARAYYVSPWTTENPFRCTRCAGGEEDDWRRHRCRLMLKAPRPRRGSRGDRSGSDGGAGRSPTAGTGLVRLDRDHDDARTSWTASFTARTYHLTVRVNEYGALTASASIKRDRTMVSAQANHEHLVPVRFGVVCIVPPLSSASLS